ncbi:MAG: hypothetical protein MK033_00775 [Candidatus Caenarcaniphilales bacterium]|nr:hypothetical protein [Candidatus Caenarcaniphilales bacterium]
MPDLNLGSFLSTINSNFREIDGIIEGTEKNNYLEKVELETYQKQLESKEQKSEQDQFINKGLKIILSSEEIWKKFSGSDNAISENEIKSVYSIDNNENLQASLNSNNLEGLFEKTIVAALNNVRYFDEEQTIPLNRTEVNFQNYLNTARDNGALPSEPVLLTKDNINNSILNTEGDHNNSFIIVRTSGDGIQDSRYLSRSPLPIGAERSAFGGIDEQDIESNYSRIDKKELIKKN